MRGHCGKRDPASTLAVSDVRERQNPSANCRRGFPSGFCGRRCSGRERLYELKNKGAVVSDIQKGKVSSRSPCRLTSAPGLHRFETSVEAVLGRNMQRRFSRASVPSSELLSRGRRTGLVPPSAGRPSFSDPSGMRPLKTLINTSVGAFGPAAMPIATRRTLRYGRSSSIAPPWILE